MKLLVANRGEVAVRILRTAGELAIPTVALSTTDEPDALHLDLADERIVLPGIGPAAYGDLAALIAAARSVGATHLHPGYGFASEDPALARACRDAGIGFVGPPHEALAVLGDKVTARHAALAAGFRVLHATGPDASVAAAADLLRRNPQGIVWKAHGAGGGRALHVVHDAADLADAHRRCLADALAAGAPPRVFAEALLPGARHIEVQVLGVPDGDGVTAVALGDRDCSVQRRHQKLLELAPAPGLDPALRAAAHGCAARLCGTVGATGLATVELLCHDAGFVFLEVNPRLQVEHPVTEAVTGLDLVALGLHVAAGRRIDDLGLPSGILSRRGAPPEGSPAPAHGIALECRVNAETLAADGTLAPATGTVTATSFPTGRGIRVDTALRPGTLLTGRFDTLVAKIVVHVDRADRRALIRRAAVALAETAVAGVATNRRLLLAILQDDDFRRGPVPTDWFDRARVRLLADAERLPPAPGEQTPPISGARPVGA